MDVTGLGFSSLDYVGIVPRLPGLDEGVGLTDLTTQGGGPVAQALVTLARLGAAAGYIGRFGDDPAGAAMRQSLLDEEVDLTELQLQPGASSAQCIILVDQATGKRSICGYTGTAGDVDAASMSMEYVCSGRFLHLDGFSMAAALAAAAAARQAGVQVCLDAGGPLERLRPLIALTDILIANEPFTLAAGNGDYERGAARLHEFGPRIVVATLGATGSYTVTDDDAFLVSGFPVDVVDTTGAGDVFHGAYLFGLLKGWTPRAIATFANAAAALKCTRLGGRAGIPRFAAVESFLQARGHSLSAPMNTR
jgi:sulfofructose kinase